ncbi:flavin reductase family protein [Lacisediminihabitans sp. H27-G8]|uniref:flavin reductase family protein n=1 Tax=Lacisediminihabitans sp. H27-G8 TaxID=3111909 RepID=UPI0038FC687C
MSTDIDPGLFREALGHYPTGVAVVTAVLDDGTPAGMVVGTFSSVSLDPPLVAFFPMKGSSSFAILRTAKNFCINVLASDQEPLCRKLATGGSAKFDGVGWRPAPMGSPILDGAVTWIECTFEETREAGDHYIVLGRVQEFALERSTLPLLFFQGGYGRFSPGSFVAAGPDPELIQAAQFAQTIRSEVERLSTEFGVNCSVLARVRWDAVQVLAANNSPHAEPFPLGHRQPLVPPFGAIFLADAGESDVDEWMRRAPDNTPERRALNQAVLDKVKERGYSLLTVRPEVMQQHDALLAAFEESERLPRHERAVRQATSDLTEHFTPDLEPGQLYDIATLVVLLPAMPGLPPMALRMTGLPQDAPADEVESWIGALKSVAATVSA